MVMGKPLDILVLGLVSAWLFVEGVECQVDGYHLEAPNAVSVQEGLCVLIPCSFTYKASDGNDNAPLYGYWFEKGSSWEPAMASNDPNKPIAVFAHGRFQLIGDVNQSNCSLVIDQVRMTDGKEYYFRIEKGRLKFSYKDWKVRVYVTVRVHPKIQIMGSLRAGHPANVTCTAPESCSPPHIKWTGAIVQNSTSTAELRNGVYSSTLNFTPSAVDHEQDLTCSVYYGALHMETVVRLNVSYQPKNMRINMSITRAGKTVPSSQGKDLVVQEGDIVYLLCQVEARPDPMLTWMKDSKTLGTPLPGKEHQLNLSKVHREDAGEYRCHAENVAGSISMHVWLNMQESFRYSWKLSLTILIILCLLKVLLCFLFFGVMFWRNKASSTSRTKE